MPAIIATFLAALSRLFASRIGAWVVALLLYFGISIGGYKMAVEPLLSSIKSTLSGLSADAVNWIAFLGLDKAITIVFSAYVIRWGIGGAKVFLRKRGTA